MANAKTEHRIAKIHIAAGHFANVTRDVKVIADICNTTERTILRWSKEPEWKIALEAINYTGDRSFRVKPTRDIKRENGEIFKKARDLFIKTLTDTGSRWGAAEITAEEVGKNPRTIYEWSLKFEWRKGTRY